MAPALFVHLEPNYFLGSVCISIRPRSTQPIHLVLFKVVVISVVTVDIVVARKSHGVNSWIYANTGPKRPFSWHACTHTQREGHCGYHNEEVRAGEWSQCQPSLSLLVFQSLTTPYLINQILKCFLFCLILEYWLYIDLFQWNKLYTWAWTQ